MTQDGLFEGWLTVAEFAGANGVRVQRVYEWMARGLPYSDRLGHKRIHVETAKTWLLDSLKEEPQAAA